MQRQVHTRCKIHFEVLPSGTTAVAMVAQVWGIFSLTGTKHPEGKNPLNTLVMISDRGSLELVYHKIFPWVPNEPWTASSDGTKVLIHATMANLLLGFEVLCSKFLFQLMHRFTYFSGVECRPQYFSDSITLASSLVLIGANHNASNVLYKYDNNGNENVNDNESSCLIRRWQWVRRD